MSVTVLIRFVGNPLSMEQGGLKISSTTLWLHIRLISNHATSSISKMLSPEINNPKKTLVQPHSKHRCTHPICFNRSESVQERAGTHCSLLECNRALSMINRFTALPNYASCEEQKTPTDGCDPPAAFHCKLLFIHHSIANKKWCCMIETDWK